MPTFRRSPLLALTLFLLLSGAERPSAVAEQPPVVLLGHADVLPLDLDAAVAIRKVKADFLETPAVTGVRRLQTENSEDQSIAFERRRLLYGAITPSDQRARYGDYYAFFWRARRPGHFTVRLEYRQQKLGAFVQAREVDYPAGEGNHVTRFSINGDDYVEQGRVSAWRLAVVEDHRKIVALKQSYLWR